VSCGNRSRFCLGLRIAAVFWVGLCPLTGGGETSSGENYSVRVAYVPSWGLDRVAKMDLEDAGLTHLVYAFVKPVYERDTGDVKLLLDFPGDGTGDDRDGAEALGLFLAITRDADLRKLVSFGGWDSSEYFSDIASNESTRRLFAERVRAFVLAHGFDGVDLDWEYPLEGGAEGTVYRAEDPANLVKLALAVRRSFAARPEAGDKVLTVAIPGSYQPLATRYRLRPLSALVDWFHLMAYDFAGPWLAGVGHNAPLVAPGSPSYFSPSVSGAVAALKVLGVPPEKTVLGISLSGVRFVDVGMETSSVKGAPYESVDEKAALDGWNDHRNLVPWVSYPLDIQDWTVVADPESRADLLVSKSIGTVISFESQRAAVAKARFAAKQGLRGLMFWSLDKDGDELPLIRKTVEAFGPSRM